MEDFSNDTQQATQHDEASHEEASSQENAAETAPVKRGPTLEENIARMREKMERLERDHERERKLRMEAEEAAKRNAESVGIGIGDDDLVEGKHLSKYHKELNQVKQEMAAYKGQILETRIRSNFPDFEAVVNRESVERLAQEHPELSDALRNTTDEYSRASSAYKLIKNLGLAPTTPIYDKDKQRANDNLNKPRPLSSVSQTGEGPLTKANIFAEGLTPELTKALRKEMEEARKKR